jgi:tRNA/rRNA methyltransferase
MNPQELLSSIRIVLCRPSHPGNIGAVARAMKVMGLHDLCLVTPRQFPDPEADTRATGAVDVLASAVVCETLDQALAGTQLAYALSARVRDLGPQPLQPRAAANLLLAAARTSHAPVALVFGNETSGLTNEEIQRCQASVTIPTNPDFSSLNLGSAVQVLAYELRLAAFDDKPVIATTATLCDIEPATHDAIEGFYAHLENVMINTGFLDPERPRRLMPKLRRLFARAGLDKDEVNILRGILSATEHPTGSRHENKLHV